MPSNTLEAGWLLRQIDAAHERASKLPGWLTKSSKNSEKVNDDRRTAEARASEAQQTIQHPD